MIYLNQVMLIGNLGEDPEILKESESGCFVRLSLASNKKYANAQGDVVQETQWHTVYLNNGMGKYASSHLKKGNEVFISGELRKSEWKNKKGQTQYSTGVYAKVCKLFANQPPLKDDAV